MDIRKAVDKSIQFGLDRGRIHPERDAALIEMIRYMADRLDSDSGNTPTTRYITPASFLSYCEKLGLQPDLDMPVEAPKGLVGHSKWKQ